VRYLVVLRHAAYIRSLETTVRALCEHGHEVRILLGNPDVRVTGPAERLAMLEAEFDGLTVGLGVEPRTAHERDLGGELRCWLDYLFFMQPAFDRAPKIRARGRRAIPGWLAEAMDHDAGSPELRASLAAAVRVFERTLPVSDAIRECVAAEHPDVLLTSPLIERRSPQVGYLRAARDLGIPAALCVRSWDNLTTSGLIHETPDLVTVWNDAQVREAVDLHRIPADRVVVTGAGMYDEWFEQRPSTSRAEFCARVGLPSDRPYLVYACSSNFIAPDEADWIVRWIKRIRRTAPELADVPILVRPHPGHTLLDGSPAAERLSTLAGIVIHPLGASHPTIPEALPDYYDTLHYAAAVIGINTSAMIESAMAGTGVYVLLADPYRDTTQLGTPHFAHLRTAGGGLIGVADTVEEHVTGLLRAVRAEDRDEVARRSEAFLSAFIRPHGLDRPATPILVSELERLGERGVAPVRRIPGPPDEELRSAAASLEDIFRIRPPGRIGGLG
jgi:hypothetical protein